MRKWLVKTRFFFFLSMSLNLVYVFFSIFSLFCVFLSLLSFFPFYLLLFFIFSLYSFYSVFSIVFFYLSILSCFFLLFLSINCQYLIVSKGNILNNGFIGHDFFFLSVISFILFCFHCVCICSLTRGNIHWWWLWHVLIIFVFFVFYHFFLSCLSYVNANNSKGVFFFI